MDNLKDIILACCYNLNIYSCYCPEFFHNNYLTFPIFKYFEVFFNNILDFKISNILTEIQAKRPRGTMRAG